MASATLDAFPFSREMASNYRAIAFLGGFAISRNDKTKLFTFRPVTAAAPVHCKWRLPTEPDLNSDDGPPLVDSPFPDPRIQRPAW